MSGERARDAPVLSKQFRKAAQNFAVTFDVRMLKLVAVPFGTPRRLVSIIASITYENEDLRRKWVASDIHQEFGAQMEKRSGRPITPSSVRG